MKIKKILVSQPEPQTKKSPYCDLAKRNGLKIKFRPFIQVKGVSSKNIRKDRINISDFTAVIFTSKTAIDHYFRICAEMRIPIKNGMKYFCISESIAYYLQKYIIYRKRKIFFGKRTINDLVPYLLKNQSEKYILPVSDVHNSVASKALKDNKIKFKKVILYRTVSCDLSDLKGDEYDIMVFYTPFGVKSLLKNFPNFEQKKTKIASFGPATAKAVKDAGLKLDIQAPIPEAPSMIMALDLFIKNFNKNGKTT